MNEQEVKEKLKEYRQTQLLRFYDELTEREKKNFLSAAEKIDWSFTTAYAHPEDLSGAGREIEPLCGLKVQDIEKRKEEFLSVGVEALNANKVALCLLAGGQGTRLGVDGPKGAYDIGITKPLYIFERQIQNVFEEVRGATLPYLCIMTSEKNDTETKEFLERHDYFGYPKEKVGFFVQDMMPAVDFDGKIYLERKDQPALSPNGNGGWFTSLQRSPLYAHLKNTGVEWINVYAVDNVLQRIADPVFIGATILSGTNCGAKVVSKVSPEERVGVLCSENGKPQIIEYYELTEEMANRRNEDGSLVFSGGVILNYLFRLSKLEEKANSKIPVHVVKKKIPYINEVGESVAPEKENGLKFETLAVDLVKEMESVLPFEVVREREFAPIKNKTGQDSVESARRLLEQNGVKL